MVYTIQNDHLCASVQSLGAQLCSLREVSTGRETCGRATRRCGADKRRCSFPPLAA